MKACSQDLTNLNRTDSKSTTARSFRDITSPRMRMVVVWAMLLLSVWLALGTSGLASAGPGMSTTDHELPTRLVIPSIDLDSAVTPVGWRLAGKTTSWDVPDDAVGWHFDSAIPGCKGNVVLSGHHNIKGKVFRNLKKVRVGDKLTLYSGDQAFEYQVTQRMILREAFQSRRKRLANARWVGEFGDERLTLVTCHPSWTNTHRLVVVAKPVPSGLTNRGMKGIP